MKFICVFFFTFPHDVLDQGWYLIELIPYFAFFLRCNCLLFTFRSGDLPSPLMDISVTCVYLGGLV